MSNCPFINEEDPQSLIERKLNENEISENLYQCNALEKRVEELELFEQNIAENGVL